MAESLDIDLANSLNTLILDPLPPETRQRSLRLALGHQDSAIVPLDQITEIFNIEIAKILPVPELPPYVLGICNWRGEMLWVIDFYDFWGHESVQLDPASPILVVIVVQVNNHSIGVGVPHIGDVEFHDLQHLQPVLPGLFSPGLLPLIAGLLPENNGVVLNLKAIADCPVWKSVR
ncbi:chemotaxis protein CheW [Egbenema bharatensis]|uniref:chemotaxis protein CheW n=1 Tax=Egbenema bharatensis TaxID=3463334 RepID=UPI003A850894